MFKATVPVRTAYYSLLAIALVCFFTLLLTPKFLRPYSGGVGLVAWLSSAVLGAGSRCPGCNCQGLYRSGNGYYAPWFPDKCDNCGYDYDADK